LNRCFCTYAFAPTRSTTVAAGATAESQGSDCDCVEAVAVTRGLPDRFLSVPISVLQGPRSSEYSSAPEAGANRRRGTTPLESRKVCDEIEQNLFRPVQLGEFESTTDAAFAFTRGETRSFWCFGGYGRGPSVIVSGCVSASVQRSVRLLPKAVQRHMGQSLNGRSRTSNPLQRTSPTWCHCHAFTASGRVSAPGTSAGKHFKAEEAAFSDSCFIRNTHRHFCAPRRSW
jgi:hypothetical protein